MLKDIYKKPTVVADNHRDGKPELSIILVDWSCRESIHALHYLNDQSVGRDRYEIVWIEYYGRRLTDIETAVNNARETGKPPVVDRWLTLNMPDDTVYHRHLMYNAGIVAAGGEVVAFCDSDVICGVDFVQGILEAFSKDRDIVVHLDKVCSIERRFYPFNYPSTDDIKNAGVNWENGITTGLNDKEIPKHSYFSFISPQKDGIDYYWLFQLTLYGAYAAAGDNGLIALRAILYMATVLMVFGFIFRGRLRNNDNTSAYLTAVLVLCMLVLVVRDMVLRPHMFNYLYIVIFLYILEYRPRMVVILPLLALPWCNMHGIEYPVLILLTLSYVIERYVDRFRNKTAFTAQDRVRVVALIASICAIYLTPDPVRLIGLPFQPIQYASTYIGELRTLTLTDILSFNVSPRIINHLTVNNLAIATVLLCVVTGIARRELRISHLLLFGGAVILLTKGSRFITEFVLLSLPILVNHMPLSPGGMERALKRPVSVILIIVLMSMPFVFLKTFKGILTGYPYNPTYNPRGITRFLNTMDAGGRVMSEVTVGGYLIWQLGITTVMAKPTYSGRIRQKVMSIFG
ncbi:membrane protein containing Glycosyl transferase, family 2 domain protein [Candidatus Magnetobacterium bavaricum]|uniref:Membrane protein containing Glycosyl transferase, family 2 domain protein n=1 Tax=Candidatus Magnetobacterium bavaricum TaxID=29290 RepID=A0A0F3GUX2_9BACT|nr:membrane protein containing Glycosyl transferase, family 2 domain protein [Candidatus Magnetobacterium bavaricum]